MTVTVVRWADLVPEPWRNGGGLTRQVAAGVGWRVSIADISADGPFSAFPGTDRVITLLEGPAPTLTIDGNEKSLELLTPSLRSGMRSRNTLGSLRSRCSRPHSVRACAAAIPLARSARVAHALRVRRRGDDVGTAQKRNPAQP